MGAAKDGSENSEGREEEALGSGWLNTKLEDYAAMRAMFVSQTKYGIACSVGFHALPETFPQQAMAFGTPSMVRGASSWQHLSGDQCVTHEHSVHEDDAHCHHYHHNPANLKPA
jgi:hypothetical protein